MMHDVKYALGVYLIEAGIVIGYVVGWIPLHPIILMLPLVGFIHFKIEGGEREGLGLTLPRSVRPLLFVLVFAALSLGEHIIRLRLEGISLRSVSLTAESMGTLAKAMVVDLFVIALWEEIVSRGYIQTRLQRVWGMGGVMVAALLFAFLHLPSALSEYTLPGVAFRLLQTGLSGFLLGYLYWQTGSVLLPILLHGLRNGVGSLVSYVSGLSFAQIAAVQIPFQLAWSAAEVGLMILACRFLLLQSKGWRGRRPGFHRVRSSGDLE